MGIWLGLSRDWEAPAARVNDGSLKHIGVSLLTTYSLGFEIISLVLLVAILGGAAVRALPLSGLGVDEAQLMLIPKQLSFDSLMYCPNFT